MKKTKGKKKKKKKKDGAGGIMGVQIYRRLMAI
jgi:hypothetical protein